MVWRYPDHRPAFVKSHGEQQVQRLLTKSHTGPVLGSVVKQIWWKRSDKEKPGKLVAGITRRIKTPKHKSNSLQSLGLFHRAQSLLRYSSSPWGQLQLTADLFMPLQSLLCSQTLFSCLVVGFSRETKPIAYTQTERFICKNWLTQLWGKQVWTLWSRLAGEKFREKLMLQFWVWHRQAGKSGRSKTVQSGARFASVKKLSLCF